MATQQSSAPGGTVEQAQEKGKELASQAKEQVQEKTQEVRGQLESRFREQVDERSTQAGEQAESIAHAIRRGSEQLRTEGKDGPARAVDQAADKVQELGSYLRGADADRILHDVESFARRRPWLTAATGAVAGFLASRFVKASSERRYEANGHGGTYVPYTPPDRTGAVR
jgi:vacuolar-type H+-ATPase subunit H